MDESQAPKDCPACATASARIIRIAPEVLVMSPDKRKTIETNEKTSMNPSFQTKTDAKTINNIAQDVVVIVTSPVVQN